jgi:hypothetical protein
MDTKTILKQLGFEEIQTGGGCTAMQKCFSDGTGILVTNNGGATTEGMDDGIIIGFEDSEGEPHLQVIVEKPKDILKFTNEYLNPFTEAFESILDSKFKIHNYKNHTLDESSDRTGWTGTLWRLGHTKCIGHASQLDNERVEIKWKEDGEDIFRKFCIDLPSYTRKNRLEHYGINTDDLSKRELDTYLVFSEEVVAITLANQADQIWKEV